MRAPGGGDRFGQVRAGRVHRLEHAASVHAARHLADEHRRETLVAQTLVHTQEVDFRQPLLPASHMHILFNVDVETSRCRTVLYCT